LLTDLPALPKRGERGWLRFVGGATVGMLYPTLIVPLLALKARATQISQADYAVCLS
jgi:hypothetical protein